jgi:hypothetical protein
MIYHDKIILRGDKVEEKDKDVHIQFIAPQSTRKKFKDVCKKLGYSPSAWLRVQVEKLIKENEK